MKLWNHYHIPRTTDEAVQLLSQYAGKARIIAGGTDLLVEMRAEGGHTPQHALVDITRIPEMTAISEDANFIYIGGGVTHTQIVKSALLERNATCLVESCGVIGGPQVRNVATLGGNVAHALPAGDGTTSLVALATETEIIKEGQRQWVNILEMFHGPGQSLIDSTKDLLVQFRFKRIGQHEATAFQRIMRPQGVALPVLGCAVWVRLNAAHTHFDAARICIAPTGPRPQYATEVENALIGKLADDTTIDDMAALAQKTLHPRTSKYRATAAYRQEMIAVLVKRTLTLAVKRVKTGEIVPEGVGL